MLFQSELVALVLYSFQQFGIMLGVGAETILLIVYLVSLRDGVVEPKEVQFARVIRRALYGGLGIIIFSGAGVVAYHALLGQAGVMFQPAFLFKWAMVALLLLATLARPRGAAFSHPLWEGAVGGTWYALFLVHILAPVTSWPVLLGFYGLWLAGFEACWWALAHAMQGGVAVAIKPVPHSPPAPVSKPIVVVPAPHKPAFVAVPRKPFIAPAASVPHKPTPAVVPVPRKPAGELLRAPEQLPELPALHVMPRTPQEVSNQFRGAVVTLRQE